MEAAYHYFVYLGKISYLVSGLACLGALACFVTAGWIAFHCRVVYRWLAEWDREAKRARGVSRSAMESAEIFYPTAVLFLGFVCVFVGIMLLGIGEPVLGLIPGWQTAAQTE